MRTEIPVCIFAKPSAPGQVKTRLISALGAAGAAGLASAMLRDVWHTVESYPGVRPILATTGPGPFPIVVQEEDIWLQGEGDLGQRIERIALRGLSQSSIVLLAGADSPAFHAAHLSAALEAIATHDAVVGPCTDGGFYLLALRRCPAGLFSALPWSTGQTREALNLRLREYAFSIAELDHLFDVDTPADLATLAAYLAEAPDRPCATRDWWVANSCASASSFRP